MSSSSRNNYLTESAYRGSQNGQTLIMIMLVLLIMLIACLFLVDIQHIIKVKAKSVSAVDSAALVGAEWQRHTLNMIGEINLIKGTTALITDFAGDSIDGNYVTIPPGLRGDSQEPERAQDYIDRIQPQIDRFKQAMSSLTEMQVRLSFVGPLLGLGALQQAAKNNGLHRSPGCNHTGIKHYNDLLTANKYTTLTSQTIRNYNWRLPYAAMLYEVLQVSNGNAYGFVADPHPSYLSYPDIEGFQFLVDESLYDAINSRSWCHRVLRQILRNGLANNWWEDINIVQDSLQFPGESEYLTLNIEFSGFSNERYYQNMAVEGELSQQEAFSSLYAQRGLTPTSSLFDDRVNPYLSNITVNNANKNPDDVDWKYHNQIMNSIVWAIYDDRNWNDYPSDFVRSWSRWLRGSFQEGYTYSGCISYIGIRRTPDVITSQWKTLNSSGLPDKSQSNEKYLGDTMRWADKVNSQDSSGALKAAEKKLRQGPETLSTDSAAKPFGRLVASDGTFYTPQTASVILPVFTHSALIPVSLEKPNGANMDDDDSFMVFLTEYLPVLAEAGSIEEMQQWMDSNGYTGKLQKYHNALLRISDPVWRQEGIDWLDTPIDEDEPDGDTNEDLCDRWTNRGGPGPRTGPGALH